VTGPHSDIGPELRNLARKILDQIDPAVRLAASRAVGGGAGTGKCQQVWCPVCALAAVVNGDEHPLLTVIAEHSVSLLAVIRTLVRPHLRPLRPMTVLRPGRLMTPRGRVVTSPSPSPSRSSRGSELTAAGSS